MKKGELIIIFVLIIVVAFTFGFNKLSGNVVEGGPPADSEGYGFRGPTQEQQRCMMECTGCSSMQDTECLDNVDRAGCEAQCGVETSGPPTPEGEGEACMQECIVRGCGEYDFDCQNAKMESCEDECEMKGDAPDESEMGAEELCISECVNAEDPTVICGSSKEGETGNVLCQRCADSCVHLYEGPCLDDKELAEKEEACKTCEHCYGEPVTGPSGQGWDCIVDVECRDASGEFGDEAGTGPDSYEEGHEGPGIIGAIGDFFSGLFGDEETREVEESNSVEISAE